MRGSSSGKRVAPRRMASEAGQQHHATAAPPPPGESPRQNPSPLIGGAEALPESDACLADRRHPAQQRLPPGADLPPAFSAALRRRHAGACRQDRR